MPEINVAIAGATGAVGLDMIATLEKRNFPVKNLRLFASERSAGKKLRFRGNEIKIEVLNEHSFDQKNIDIALFSAGAARSKEFASCAVKNNALVIDNSSAFRMDTDVPLVVPEVNPEDIKKHKGIIANPNCSTIIMVVALKPIYDAFGITRVIASTYQAVSGAGSQAMAEAVEQTRKLLANEKIEPVHFAHQIAFNLIPHIDVFQENGYTKEEMKMISETRKIMHDDTLRICATTVRVPVLRAHSESLNIELRKKASPDDIRRVLAAAPGIKVFDCPEKKEYPMPFFIAGRDDVYAGRIRTDLSCENGIAMWVVGDQLLKGAALNAVQIAEKYIGI
ncbi:MAG TPA: aspartate-semialdehyde dehydrogenase [Spirochaetia bacterium]|nr:aspartate-semialdehyde dehydrogenase [Spirochaetia bacterium]